MSDLRFALRTIAKNPGFAAVVVLTLALGIGATTAIFSVVYAVVLEPFPFPDPDRVVVVGEALEGQVSEASGGNFHDWHTQSTSFEQLAAFYRSSMNLADGDTLDRVVAARTTHNFFSVFGIRPSLGRTYTTEEDQPGREQVVVLSHRLWSRRFASNPDVVGRQLRMDGRSYTVIGVMAEEFDRVAASEELWAPIAFTRERLTLHDEHFLTVVGRLAPGVSIARANAELQTIYRRMQAQLPGETQIRVGVVESFASIQLGDVSARLLTLLGAVTLVLLIACVNVAHLLLARGGVRSHEVALRTALGASRARLVQQLLTETSVLALVGGALGVVLVHALVPALVAAGPEGVPRLDQAGVNGPVLLFALCVAVASALVAGLVPAIRTAGSDPIAGLKTGGRGASPSRDRLRAVLVAAEVSAAIVLLIGAGLLVRSAIHLQRLDTGFDATGVLSARVTLPTTGYEDPSRVAETFRTVADTLATSPGVASAAVSSNIPMTPGGNYNGLVPEGKVFDPNDFVLGRLAVVTHDYFRAMRIPLVGGRLFTDDDRRDALPAMVLSETAARRLFPGEDALGKRVACCEEGRLNVVVGIVGDVRSLGPQQTAPADFYLPLAQAPRDNGDDPSAIVAALREAVRQFDPTVPVYDVATMPQRLQTMLAPAQFNTVLMLLLGTIGLLLASIGIYGVVAYFVAQRRRDIAIRIALGARHGDVARMVVGHAIRPVVFGVVIGLVAATATSQILTAYVYGITTSDALTFAAVVAMVVGTALLATAVPVLRAARLDPAIALRAE
jgi:predicted permease